MPRRKPLSLCFIRVSKRPKKSEKKGCHAKTATTATDSKKAVVSRKSSTSSITDNSASANGSNKDMTKSNDGLFHVPASVPVLQWQSGRMPSWLDCLLSLFVYCSSVRATAAGRGPGAGAAIRSLLSTYDAEKDTFRQALARHGWTPEQKLDESSVAAVLAACASRLDEARMAFFRTLPPRLHVTLGRAEGPALAWPHLLRASPKLEALFLLSYSWESRCEHCENPSRYLCHGVLPTIMGITSDWHPLNATQWGPCTKCQASRQPKQLRWHRLSRLVLLHFEQGLPHTRLYEYDFSFSGAPYAISALVQRCRGHFVSWLRGRDGKNSFEFLKSSWTGQRMRENTARGIKGSTAPKDEVNTRELCQQDRNTGWRKQLNVGIRVGCCMLGV
uniref:Ubiquitin-specific peptidase-like SUMO isopeptidase domain-containing protein n=1 Tax=Eptatretus burgeri TaxID=7764 RepID=A0A8C4NG33_EPTBU